jgi:DNA-binding transcriptional MerR regulator
MKGGKTVYTVAELVQLLGLSTENQVRNRIEAVRDLLVPELRRGPNNQLLVTERGLELLRGLQDLVQSGYTLKEASNILRYKAEQDENSFFQVSHKSEQNRENPGPGWQQLLEHLARELEELRRRVDALEAAHRPRPPWWLSWLGGD